ncbi:disintegrin and metalloproteinase domain-containing protein 10-like [Rhipicephalus sanguineus]|uniref:disintegrin and metalloproteinase domain-containing protein 10-like n=1 Tax=Rhipicephalus sanguineus TaxID=34632 RepID=UPI0020C4BAD0|nr:disintegrin and metalloproteinase domain-containing protein 10-like [Rhipicephalus sanguineus]
MSRAKYLIGMRKLQLGTQQPRLVYPRLLEERSSDGRMVMHLYDNLTLNLRKASVAARNFRVLEHEDGHEVTHFFNGEDIERNLHEDEKQFATVHVRRKESGIEVEGVVGLDQRIQPVPTTERSDDGLIPHVIYQIERKEMLDIEMALNTKDVLTPEERRHEAQDLPSLVIIELFIVSDRLHHKHFTTTHMLIEYLCVHTNSVNMRYADTSNPRVRFMLVGVERDSFSTYRKGYSIYMESSSTLQAFQVYAYGKRQEYGNPDVTYLMTGFDVFSRDANNKMSTSVLGIGYVGGLCTRQFVALGEDSGLYDGMHTLTHEGAHVLGAAHDQSQPNQWIPGDPGSLSCPWSRGNIMSYVDGGINHHRFSVCSLRQIRHLVIMRGWMCWNVSNTGYTKHGWYPGMEVRPNEYCKSVFPDKNNVSADMDSPDVSKCMVKCQYPEVRQTCRYPPCYTYTTIHSSIVHALDYTTCGKGEVCIRGVCGRIKADTPQQPHRPSRVPAIPATQTPQMTTTTTMMTTKPTEAHTTECRCDCSPTASTAPTQYGPRLPPPTPTLISQRNRLSQTKSGREILIRARIPPHSQNMDEGLVEIQEPVRRHISIAPIPRNMTKERHKDISKCWR